MAKPTQRETQETPWLSRPEVGSGLSIVSGLAFLFLCMLLPLVGKAGAQTDHYTQNFIAFLLVLLITLGLSGAAVKSKLDRRARDGSPLPKFSLMILGFSVLFFFALISGLLKI